MNFILPEFEAQAAPLTGDLLQDPAIAGFLNSARMHLGLELAFIARWVDAEAREITHVDTALDLPISPGFRQHRDETYCWHALNGDLPELIADPADHPFAQQLHITTALPVGCNISLPLRMSDGTIWGSFCVLGREPDHSLNPRDLSIVESFAAMSAERIADITSHAEYRQQTRERIEDMFDGHAVTIFQQPIHALSSGEPVGVECLARFPDINKRGPGAWFDDAEATGLGVELEMTAVRGALETLGNVPEGFFASVKAPARTVLSDSLREALAQSEGAETVITLTQYAGVADHEELAKCLAALRPYAKIALDGVGSDYASLQLLAAIQPDFVKLDMRLTRGIDQNPAARAMVSAVVELARTFSAKVVGEGIENAEEAACLQGLGVDYGQGYLFARPMPMVAAAQHLKGITA